MYPFSQGLPGSMKRVVTPTRASHARTALAVSSGPLAERRDAGVPRATKSSVSCWSTSSELRRRATRMARHSRVYSVHHRQQPQGLPVVGPLVDDYRSGERRTLEREEIKDLSEAAAA